MTHFTEYFRPFVIPFTIGAIFLFAVIIFKYAKWFVQLEKEDKKIFWKALFSKATPKAIVTIVKESLIHISIFKTNPLLGYMHCSLAFGWFLLIVVGWADTFHLTDGESAPLFVHIFAKYYFPHPQLGVGSVFAFLMDFILLVVLSGVGLAMYKRFKSRAMGMKRATKHFWGDKFALAALWWIFPTRLIAESVTSGIYDSGSFLTNSIGLFMAKFLPLVDLQLPCWWIYSSVLAIFFIALPFSRYMHIFTEIPHILLKEYGIRPKEHISSIDNFQIQSCSRCGICIDPCQLQRDLNINDVQSVYFIRDRRHKNLTNYVMNNCLMCGRCGVACPVDIDMNTLRLNSRIDKFNSPAEHMYKFIEDFKPSLNSNKTKIGYFSGCMTMLTPAIIKSMKHIFSKSGDDYWFADENGGVCCGRPMKLSGEKDAADKMIEFNKNLFLESGITTLVTSCPICLKTFKEDYQLSHIEIIHHSQYIDRLITEGKIKIAKKDTVFTYHDPCELGRGSNIYDEPRSIINKIGKLVEPEETKNKSLCCGFSLANNHITFVQKQTIAQSASKIFDKTGAEILVTSCPLCKVAFKNNAKLLVKDISECVASQMI